MKEATGHASFSDEARSPLSIDVNVDDGVAELEDYELSWSDPLESSADGSCFSGSNNGFMLGGFFCELKDVAGTTSLSTDGSQSGSPTSPTVASSFSKYLASLASEDCWTADDIYACDEFRMFEFKVRRCTRGRSHDWTECPFAHPGEKARRRDPRRFHYSGTACPDFRKGNCRRGDACEFAHGVFECWLHPARYRTQPCKDGRNCTRRVCFFAHTTEQLRLLPAAAQAANSAFRNGGSYDVQPSISSLKAYLSGSSYMGDSFDGSTTPFDVLGSTRGHGSFDRARTNGGSPRVHHICSAASHVSPISTLAGMPHSPPSISPPLSPSQSSPVSPHSWHGPLSPTVPIAAAARGLLPHSAIHSPTQSNLPRFQALLAAAQTDAASSFTQRQFNSVPTSALSSLAQKSFYKSFSSAPPSPAGMAASPSRKSVTDLVAALQQLELKGANQIWLQHTSPHASAPSPLSRTSNRVSAFDNVWDTDAIEEDEGRVERVESGKALRAEIYGKVAETENCVDCEESPDLGWVNDLVLE
ncbi:hypothetical protein O6H91_12G104300 [Diphasiastrum complanatum]|nr:hypothetical protein O6H91_12G104300 [Diphasiastrum complanatum]